MEENKASRTKREYDFSKGVRGKFYQANVRLRLPGYLDEDVSRFILEVARRKKSDPQTVVNKLLRDNKEDPLGSLGAPMYSELIRCQLEDGFKHVE